jgi:hypothetical protein
MSAPIPLPAIHCRPLPAFAGDDLAEVRAAFGDATPIPLQQAWLDAPEPDFAPATVRTGWRDDTFLVLADLTDADIVTRATRHSERFWELGDTFEMFLQPGDARAYAEFHVTPNNLRLHLRFEAPPSPRAGAAVDPFGVSLAHADAFRSRTWVNTDAARWWVLAEIPVAVVAGLPAGPMGAAPRPLAGVTWRVSFSRYDYTRGRERPVISSSSPHSEPRFHRPDEWRRLEFAGPAGPAGSAEGSSRITP